MQELTVNPADVVQAAAYMLCPDDQKALKLPGYEVPIEQMDLRGCPCVFYMPATRVDGEPEYRVHVRRMVHETSGREAFVYNVERVQAPNLFSRIFGR